MIQLIILLSIFLFNWSTLNHYENKFSINITTSNVDSISQLNFFCDYGCAWETLTIKCKISECNAHLDQYGLSDDGRRNQEFPKNFDLFFKIKADRLFIECISGCNWGETDTISISDNFNLNITDVNVVLK